MGGSAFSGRPNPPFTPRMPTDVYRRVLYKCHSALREIFLYVATPIEGPAKKDHGDIDVLVAVDRRSVFPGPCGEASSRTNAELMKTVIGAIQAVDYIIQGSSANLLIRWPDDDECDEEGDSAMTGMHEEAAGDELGKKKRFIQVDVRICPNLDQLCWSLFKHAHGDIWNIIGSTIRPFGLTVDERALWIRIPEIEKLDRKRAKVMLSNDPVEILHFLGFKVEGFWTGPFDSVQTLFDYAATCRLFGVKKTDEPQDCDENTAGVGGGATGKKLKSNDRRRMNYRPVFRKWIEEYIPSLQAQEQQEPANKDSEKPLSELRDQVREQAFTVFHIEAAYTEQLKQWRIEQGMLAVKRAIKTSRPEQETNFRGCLHSALGKILLQGSEEFGVRPPTALRGADGVLDIKVAQDFIEENWQRIGDLAVHQRNRRYESLKEETQEERKRKSSSNTD